MSARLKKLQKLKNNFFCDEKYFMSCGVNRATFFLCFVDRAMTTGGVVVVIKIGGRFLDLQKAHNVYYV